MATKPTWRILVVDDEPVVCDSIRMLLEFDGHDVFTASSAAAAQRFIQASPVDILITDFAMPDRTGAELAAELRQAYPALRVILVTAYAEMLSSWRADLACIDCVVSKPFRFEDLREALTDVTQDIHAANRDTPA